MTARALLRLLCATAVLVPAVASYAGPRPAPFCGWIADEGGDATVEPLQPTGLHKGTHSDPALDVVSADIGTTRTGLRVVIRVADLRPPAATDAYGQDFAAVLTILERRYVVRVVLMPGADRPEATVEAGAASPAGSDSRGAEPATAVADPRRDEIRVEAPFASLRRIGPVSVGDDVYEGSVLSGRFARPEYPLGGAPVAYAVVDADRGVARSSYRIGRASCV